MKKTNVILGLILLLVIGALLFGYFSKSDAEKNWKQKDKEQQLQVYFDLTKESILLEEELGETPYITMLRSFKGNKITSGMTKTEALENAAQLIVREEALMWYAKQNHINVTDAEVAKYMKNNVIDQVRNAEGFDRMEEACNKAGMTFEDSIWAYKSSYRSEYIMSQIGDGFSEEMMTDIIADFRESRDFDKVFRIIQNCKNLIESGETDIDALRRADIYFDR